MLPKKRAKKKTWGLGGGKKLAMLHTNADEGIHTQGNRTAIQTCGKLDARACECIEVVPRASEKKKSTQL